MKKFIKASNLPPRLGFTTALAMFLVLERFGAPGWLYGVYYTLWCMVTGYEVYRAFYHRPVDVLEDFK